MDMKRSSLTQIWDLPKGNSEEAAVVVEAVEEVAVEVEVAAANQGQQGQLQGKLLLLILHGILALCELMHHLQLGSISDPLECI